jgi:hypothetical protein
LRVEEEAKSERGREVYDVMMYDIADDYIFCCIVWPAGMWDGVFGK